MDSGLVLREIFLDAERQISPKDRNDKEGSKPQGGVEMTKGKPGSPLKDVGKN